ncbi:hypothetical protein [Methylocella sp.]|uniref:hypothetical protein n=1 Tax=Methylocella sp. TaxID=1978226 RepID=UPI003784D557
MQETAGGVISPGLEEAAAAPAVQSAMRAAARKSANQAAATGAKAEAVPLAIGEDGSLSLAGAPSGRFWDHVKQALDDRIGAARRQGEMSEARDLGALKSKIVAEVDALAPSYADARGVAQRYFNGMDALEAGAQFAKGQGSTDDMLKGLFSMPLAERKLFAHAYANQLKADVLNPIVQAEEGRALEVNEWGVGAGDGGKSAVNAGYLFGENGLVRFVNHNDLVSIEGVGANRAALDDKAS